jgi:tRNA (guanosine-2'-O-)-methyltransferase
MSHEDMASRLLAKEKLFEEYAQLLTPERKALLESRAQERTRYITVVLEDLYQAHNLSAIVRTADCFGIQEVHIVEGRHTFGLSKGIVKGAEQWVSLTRNRLHHASDIGAKFSQLRNAGYKIVATSPHKNDSLISSVPLDTKVALLFGTEREGLSSYALEHADAFVKVPLYGFTESFNVSVCAGIVLYELTKRLRESTLEWRLNEQERIDLQLEWLIRTTHFGDVVKSRLESI